MQKVLRTYNFLISLITVQLIKYDKRNIIQHFRLKIRHFDDSKV